VRVLRRFSEHRAGKSLISGLLRTVMHPIALTRNEKVKGSIPLGGSTSITRPLPWKPQVSGCSGFREAPRPPPNPVRRQP